MQFILFTEQRIRETFTHFFNILHLFSYQISLVDTEGGITHILRKQYEQIDYLNQTGSLNDKKMSEWLDREVKSRIESEISSAA